MTPSRLIAVLSLVCVSQLAAPARAQSPSLANDEESGAITIPGLPYAAESDISGATPWEDDPVNHGSWPSVWYRYTPEADGRVTFDVSESDGIAGVIVFDEALGEAGVVGAQLGSLGADLVGGTTYAIEVVTFDAPGWLVLLALEDTGIPRNDELAGAARIRGVPYLAAFDISGATPNGADPLIEGAFPTVWYTYTPAADIDVAFDTSQSEGDVGILLFKAPSDPAALPDEMVGWGMGRFTASLTGGTPYVLMVAPLGTPGMLALAVTEAVPGPPYDELAGATVIDALPYDGIVDASAATGSANDPGSDGRPTIWYVFTPSFPMFATFDVTASAGDYRVVVMQVPDGGLPGGGDVVRSDVGKVSHDLLANRRYAIMVVSDGAPGEVVMHADGFPLSPPLNDEYTYAKPIGSMPFVDDTIISGATSNPADPPPGGTLPSVWFSYTAADDQVLTLDASQSQGTMTLAVFERPASGPLVAPQSPVAEGVGVLSAALRAGTAYMIMLVSDGGFRQILTATSTGVPGLPVSPPPPPSDPPPPPPSDPPPSDPPPSDPPPSDPPPSDPPPPGGLTNDDVAGAKVIDVDALPYTDRLDVRDSKTNVGDIVTDYPTTWSSSVWYRITPSRGVALTVGFGETNYAPKLELFAGVPRADGANRLLFSGGGFTAPFAEGQTFYLAVVSGNAGDLELIVSEWASPAHDRFEQARVITSLPYYEPVYRPAATRAASDPAVPRATPALLGGTTWYLFTPDRDLTLGAILDARDIVAVYRGGPGAWISEGHLGSAATGASAGVRLTAGITYAIMFDVEGANGGTANLVLTSDQTTAVVRGTAVWRDVQAASASVELKALGTIPYSIRVPATVAPDGLSASFEAILPFAASFTTVVDVSTCGADAVCADPATGAPGTRLDFVAQTIHAVAGGVVTPQLTPDDGSTVVRKCGHVDGAGEQPAGLAFSLWGWGSSVALIEPDGRYCLDLPRDPAHQTADYTVSASLPSCSTPVTINETATADTAPGSEQAPLATFGFELVTPAEVDVAYGLPGVELFHTLSIDPASGAPLGPPSCDAMQDASFEVLGESGSERLAVAPGEKTVSWTGRTFAAELDSMSLVNGAVYTGEMPLDLAAGDVATADMSMGAPAIWHPSIAVPSLDGPFRVETSAVAAVAGDEQTGVFKARSGSVSITGWRELGLAPETLAAFLMALGLGADAADVAARPNELLLDASREWSVVGALSLSMVIRELVTAEDQTLVSEAMEIQVGIAGSAFETTAFAPKPELIPPLDVPLPSAAAGETMSTDLVLLRPNEAELRLHLPPWEAIDTGEHEAGFGVLMHEPGCAALTLSLLTGTDPTRLLVTELPVGTYHGYFAADEFDAGAVLSGRYTPNLSVEVARGDVVDQTPGAPFTYDLQPPPDMTCDPSVVFSGRVSGPSPVSEVRVNGAPIELVDGAFAVPVDLGLGDNTITLEVRDAAGEWVTRTRTIQRASDVCGCGMPVYDSDADGVADCIDACPGSDDAVDPDQDGVASGCDACPADYYNDSDGDGSCDSADVCPHDAADDADGDTLCADADPCPADPDNDADHDGMCGDQDACPLDPYNDADGDGVCGNTDACPGGDDRVDTDGDQVADACDVCPLDVGNDSDKDGKCESVDPCPLDNPDDSDGDGSCDHDDRCPLDPFDDRDGDGMCGDVDPCPLDVENDADGDGICEVDDDCPMVANADQADLDGDGIGNACEPDNDGDGVIDDDDNCPLAANASQADWDQDGAGDACDGDDDQDAVNDALDACPDTALGAIVLASGCALDQLCPCANPWKNHGAYVSCVARVSGELVAEGRLTGTQKGVLDAAAGASSCGR